MHRQLTLVLSREQIEELLDGKWLNIPNYPVTEVDDNGDWKFPDGVGVAIEIYISTRTPNSEECRLEYVVSHTMDSTVTSKERPTKEQIDNPNQ